MSSNLRKATVTVTINLGKVDVYVDNPNNRVARLNALLKKKVSFELDPGEHIIKFVNPQANLQKAMTGGLFGLFGGSLTIGLSNVAAGMYAGSIIAETLTQGTLQENEALIKLAPGDEITFTCKTGVVDTMTGKFKVSFKR